VCRQVLLNCWQRHMIGRGGGRSFDLRNQKRQVLAATFSQMNLVAFSTRLAFDALTRLHVVRRNNSHRAQRQAVFFVCLESA
jgi:hypothetical protein